MIGRAHSGSSPKRHFLLTLGIALLSMPAHAGVTIIAQQVGEDVVFTGSGTVNSTINFVFGGNGLAISGIGPSSAILNNGPSDGMDVWDAGIIGGPSSFGAGDFVASSSSSGQTFGILPNSGPARLILPDGYVFGSPLAGSMTFSSETIASLGMTPGIYTWTWPHGMGTDSLTLFIGPPTIPSLGAFGLVAVSGLPGFMGLRKLRD